MKIFNKQIIAFAVIMATFSYSKTFGQTEQDALMMGKNNLCVAASYGYNSWTDYWEGSFKRENLNIGTLSAQTGMAMLNYGLRNDLNVMVSLPYVSTKASKGTLSGLNGFQDLGFFIKYRPIRKTFGKQKFSLFAVAGYTLPSNDYNIDFLPMSIGMGSKVATARIIADYQRKKLFASVSGSYMYRSNVEIDRPAYYTTHQINSNEVKMPDAGNYQARVGYRTPLIIAEAFVDYMKTFGGFDIRKNDMPFVSNEMNSTNIGLEGKYYLKKLPELGIHASYWQTVDGRNVGQSTGFMGGILYTVKFSQKSTSKK